MKRVVITGLGAVTPLGNDLESTWNNLLHKKSGIAPITGFDTSGLTSRISGQLKGFKPENYISKKDILRLDPFIHYAAAAALMACDDSGLISLNSSHITHNISLDSAGIIIGSSRGGITSMEKALEEHLLKDKPFSAYLMSSSTITMSSSYLSMRLQVKGPCLGISTACASGTNAIGEAFKMVRSGDISLVIAGGAEAPLCRFALGGYAASGALSKRNDEPEKASRPFDSDRDGFVMSEGAGIVILEELGHALKRDAKIYAELAGYSSSADAYHQTKPDISGEAEAIKMALHDADLPISAVDYINAHATSTPLGDKTEAKAIIKVFGRHSDDIYVSSCKSMLGHMLGAAGAVETAVTALSIKRGLMTSTINLDNPDPECRLNCATDNADREINTALSNSFGFGGVNAVLVLKKFNQ